MSEASRGRRLCIVGASVRAAVESAIAAGYEPVAVDLFADADLHNALTARPDDVRLVANLHRALAKLTESPPAPLWMYAGGLENHPRVIASLGRTMQTLGCSAESVSQVRRPEVLADRLARHNVRFAPILGDRAQGIWLSKPRRGSGGKGIRRLKANERIDSRRRYAQQWIDGQAASALFLARADGVVTIGVARQWIGVDRVAPFAFAGAWVCPAFEARHRDALTRIGAVIAREFSLVGLFGVDWVLDHNHQPWVVEVNPRWTASAELYERLGRGSLVARHVAACLHEPELPSPGTFVVSDDRVLGKRIEYANFSAVVAPTATAMAMDERRLDRSVADIPVADSTICPGAPLLTVFAETKTPDDGQKIGECLEERGRRWRQVFGGKPL